MLAGILPCPRGFAPRTPQHASAFARSATARPRRSLRAGGLSRGPCDPRSVLAAVAQSAKAARVARSRSSLAFLFTRHEAGAGEHRQRRIAGETRIRERQPAQIEG